MGKEIWTIEDIIKDYEDKGLAGRSKVDFLNELKEFILKNTRYVQWSTISAEEHEKVIEEMKQKIEEKMKDKDFGSIDYTNPGLSINSIYIPKKYLKWEDLKFGSTGVRTKVLFNGEPYQLYTKVETVTIKNGPNIIWENTGDFNFDTAYLMSADGMWKMLELQVNKPFSPNDSRCEAVIKFFNALHLEVIK